MNTPPSSVLRRCSFPAFRQPPPGLSDGSIKPKGLKSAFIGYEKPSAFRIPASTKDGDRSTLGEDYSYSPPPSPTLKAFIPRFQSPSLSYVSTGTPSLLDETLPTTVSSPFLNHTPMPYTTTRDPRSETTTLVGLGITGLFMRDGSVFDGMGVLPRRDECTELGFFMDEADKAAARGEDAVTVNYPEEEEDAWRKGISSPILPDFDDASGQLNQLNQFDQFDQSSQSGQFNCLGTLCSGTVNESRRWSIAGCWSPPAVSSPFHAPVYNAGPLLMEPEVDDVFFTRSPPSCGSPSGAMSGQRMEISRTIVSSWFQNTGPDDLHERLASVL